MPRRELPEQCPHPVLTFGSWQQAQAPDKFLQQVCPSSQLTVALHCTFWTWGALVTCTLATDILNGLLRHLSCSRSQVWPAGQQRKPSEQHTAWTGRGRGRAHNVAPTRSYTSSSSSWTLTCHWQLACIFAWPGTSGRGEQPAICQQI